MITFRDNLYKLFTGEPPPPPSKCKIRFSACWIAFCLLCQAAAIVLLAWAWCTKFGTSRILGLSAEDAGRRTQLERIKSNKQWIAVECKCNDPGEDF